MAYVKQTWADRLVEYPKRFSVAEDAAGNLTLTSEPGAVTTAGTALDATHLNYMEDGIEDAHNDIADIWEHIYPVGSLYETTDSTFDPNTHFGGTWEEYGQGRVVVGVDTSDTDFNSANKTGGAKTHTHTLTAAFAMFITGVNELLVRRKTGVSSWTSTHKSTVTLSTADGAFAYTTGMQVGGSTDSSSNVQPYITAYRWRRTA